MSTYKDFENAPTGAIATRADGSRAMKIYDGVQSWVTQNRVYLDNESIAKLGFTLNPLEPCPASAREALDLAWELAHPVKEGQIIPTGARCLEFYGSRLKEYIAQLDFRVDSGQASMLRTLDPLPDTEPDWIDALVVLARHVKEKEPDSPPSLWANLGGGLWGQVETYKRATVRELRDVTPLYPKGQDA